MSPGQWPWLNLNGEFDQLVRRHPLTDRGIAQFLEKAKKIGAKKWMD